MTHRYLLACILAFFCLDSSLNMRAQTPAAKALDDARILAQQGHYRQLIDTLAPFLNSSSWNAVDRSRALVLLAVGHQGLGHFSESHMAFDQALSLLRNNPQYISDYADALTNLSALYRDTGDEDAMKQTARKALQLYEQTSDHASLVGVYVMLAQNSVVRRKSADAERYLAQAEQESRQAKALWGGYPIAIVDLHAAIALLEGHSTVAVAAYKQGLDLEIQFNGRQSPQTGLGYMHLGKADLQAGDIQSAIDNMKQGLALLDQTDQLTYLYSEVAYSEALAADGQRIQAKHLKAEATEALTRLHRDQCANCQINAAAFR